MKGANPIKLKLIALLILLEGSLGSMAIAQATDPTLSASSVASPQSVIVTVSETDANAVLYYTTDGTTPTTSSSTLTLGGTVTLNRGSVLNVQAVDGSSASDVISGSYVNTGFVSRSNDHTTVLATNGSVWTWGNNPLGELGLGNTSPTNNPQQISVDANSSPFTNLFGITSVTTTTPATPTSPPSAPVDLMVNPNGSGELDIGWENSLSNNATALLVQVQNPNGSWTTIATLSGTATSYAATGLNNDQNYTYQVLAQNAAGSTSSGTSTATAPIPPQMFAVIDLGPNMYPYGLSNTGYALTSSEDYSNYYRWYQGTTSQMGGAIVWNLVVVGIADDGTVTGSLYFNNGPLTGVVWTGTSTTPTALAVPNTGGASGTATCIAQAIDYNGTIYGFTSGSTSSGLQGIYWTNPGVIGSFFGQNYVNQAKDGNWQGGIYNTTTYLVNDVPVSYMPQCINTNGTVLGVDGNGNYALYFSSGSSTPVTFTVNNSPGIVDMNYALAPKHNANGSVTQVEAPQLIDWSGGFYQFNPDTNQYVYQGLQDLVGQNNPWSGISGYYINDSGEISGVADYTPTGTSDPIPAGEHAVLIIDPDFKLINDANVFQGWDSPYSSSDKTAWTSVGVGATNTNIKLTLPANAAKLNLECVVDDQDSGYSATYISLKSVTLQGGDNNLSITGLKAMTPTLINDQAQATVQPADIVLRVKGTTTPILKLNVVVLPQVNIAVDIFYAYVPKTNSAYPQGFPTDLTALSTKIIQHLNQYYTSQTQVNFIPGSSNILPNVLPPALLSGDFDSKTGLLDIDDNDPVNGSVKNLIAQTGALNLPSTRIKLFIVKGINVTNTTLPFLAASSAPTSFVPALVDTNDFFITCAHEIGRDLNIPSGSAVDSNSFDIGQWPLEFKDDLYETNAANPMGIPGQTGLMSHNTGAQTPWIRHEDWLEANAYAKNGNPYAP